MQTECQRIIFRFLLLVSHKPPACAKNFPLPYFISPPDQYLYLNATKVMVYIKRRWRSKYRGEGWHDGGGDTCWGEGCQATWYRWWYIVRRGVAWWHRRVVTWWWWWWHLIISWQKEMNHLSGYCFPYLIIKFTKLTSNVYKCVLGGVWREVKKAYEHGFFGGRQR